MSFPSSVQQLTRLDRRVPSPVVHFSPRVLVVFLFAAFGCPRDSLRPAPPSPSLVVDRCLRGEDEACDTILIGIRNEERDQWTGVSDALCRRGATAYCTALTHETLRRWRAACAAGSFRACVKAIGFRGTIEARETADTTAERRGLAEVWCHVGERPRSFEACRELVLNHDLPSERRIAAYSSLYDACAVDLVSCSFVVTAHHLLVVASEAEFNTNDERRTAQTIVDHGRDRWFKPAAERLHQACADDWTACAYCSDRQRGFMVGRPAESAPELPGCNSAWEAQAALFRTTVLDSSKFPIEPAAQGDEPNLADRQR